MNLKLLFLVVATTAHLTGVADDAIEALPEWKPQTKKVIVFKNGLAFVLKDGATPLKNGWVRTAQLPAAALGAIWAGSTSAPVSEIVAYKDSETEEIDARTHADLLEANVGRRVVLTYLSGNDSHTVEGTLLSVPKLEKPEQWPAPQERYLAYAGRPSIEPAANLVLLRVNTNNSILSINQQAIQTLLLPGDAAVKAKRQRDVSRARIHLDGKLKQADLSMAYLVKGITWSPSYRVDIADEKMAKIAMDAVLANDVEDFKDTEISFVVGYPNFLHADILSPLSLEQSVNTFIQTLMNDRNAGGGNHMTRNQLMSQSIAFNNGDWYNAGAPSENNYSTTQQAAGEKNEDLYFYQRKSVSLKKGERASYSVFAATIPYEHIYRWDIADSMNVDNYGRRQSEDRNKEDGTRVWHVLRLQNTTRQPWTTAPAFTTKGTMPLCQDTLRYTPPGGSSALRLTVAADIRAEQSQTEASRRVLNIEGRSYEEVIIDGKLTVTNWKNKEAKLVLHKTLVGEVVGETTGKLSKGTRGVASLNPNSEIEWEFPLQPGKSNELTYKYKVLIHR